MHQIKARNMIKIKYSEGGHIIIRGANFNGFVQAMSGMADLIARLAVHLVRRTTTALGRCKKGQINQVIMTKVQIDRESCDGNQDHDRGCNMKDLPNHRSNLAKITNKTK